MLAAAIPSAWIAVSVDAWLVLGSWSGEPIAAQLWLLALSVSLPLALGAALSLRLLIALLPFDAAPLRVFASLRSWLSGDDPQRAVSATATLFTIAIWVAGSLAIMFALTLLFITRFHNGRIIAAALAVATTGVGLVAAVSFSRAVVLVAAALERVKLGRHPKRWFLFLMLLPVVALAIAASRYSQTVEAIRFGPVLAPLAVVLMTYALGFALFRLSPSRVRALALILALAAVALTVAGAKSNDSEFRQAAYALNEYGRFVRLPLPLLQGLADDDGDGFSDAFGGGDCDDEDPAIRPGAIDVPNNQVDEDCSGADFEFALDEALPWESTTLPTSQASQEPESQPQPTELTYQRNWNVILVTVDTLRYDHMGFAGYHRQDISPSIDALAAASFRFESAYSISAKTPTAVPPLLASRWPSEMDRSYDHFTRYRADNLFLAEVMSDNGYLTAASVSHWYFRPRYGFSQGFEDWREYWVSGDRMERVPTSEQVADNAIAFLDEYYAEQQSNPGDTPPYFLWVHFFDPHKLYIEHHQFEADHGLSSYGSRSIDEYDGEIRFTDFHVGRFLSVLDVGERLEDTVIIFTSDHGEAFGEHDMRHHGWDLYEHQIRVPLTIYLPGAQPTDIHTPVSHIDLAPTIVDLVGDTIPDSFRGRSLLPALARGVEPEPLPVFTEMPRGPHNSAKRSFRMGDWKLIHHPAGDRYRLFDLSNDPGEEHDLWRENPDEAARLRHAYEVFVGTQLDQVPAHGE